MNTNELSIIFKTRELNKVANEKRLFNIKAFNAIPRDSYLQFNENERLLLIYKTLDNEEIYIKYPGKETIRKNNPKPLDFRPVLKKANGTWSKDLSFPDIWDDLSSLNTLDNETVSILAAVFFHMAYMTKHILINDKFSYVDVDVNDKVTGRGTLELEFYKPQFSNELLSNLSLKIGKIRDMSLEAYLFYNDLLVQNEDCKYYYRNVYEKNIAWNPQNGRVNTILSHLSVIEYLKNNISFSEIMMRFQRGSGVAPAPISHIEIITDSIIKKA